MELPQKVLERNPNREERRLQVLEATVETWHDVAMPS